MAKPSSNPTPSPIWPTAPRLVSRDNDERYGSQGAFLIEAGISSSYHIASFFGLTDWISQPKEAVKEGFEGSRKANSWVFRGAGPDGRISPTVLGR